MRSVKAGLANRLAVFLGELRLRPMRLRRMDGRMARMEELQNEYQRETRLLLRQLTLPPAQLWLDGPPLARGNPEGLAFPVSTICRQESMETAYFHQQMANLGLIPRYHRKLWEFAYVLQSLEERGFLRPGMRGLGFGVGEERISAYLASRGCKITATDLAPEAASQAGWTDTSQHSAGKESLRWPELCSDEMFDANVEFSVCDMNAIPDDLKGYDFCWSACALEHLGSIEKGLAFIENSIKCLRPGGLAVHTTEFNIDSDTETLDNMSTVIFRKRDLEELQRRVTAAGCVMAPLHLNAGDGVIDRYIDAPPYLEHPHLILSLLGYKATSVGLIIQAPL